MSHEHVEVPEPADVSAAFWRGQVTQQVNEHGRRLGEINGDLRAINESIGTFTVQNAKSIATLQTEVKQARTEISAIGTAIEAAGAFRRKDLPMILLTASLVLVAIVELLAHFA